MRPKVKLKALHMDGWMIYWSTMIDEGSFLCISCVICLQKLPFDLELTWIDPIAAMYHILELFPLLFLWTLNGMLMNCTISKFSIFF